MRHSCIILLTNFAYRTTDLLVRSSLQKLQVHDKQTVSNDEHVTRQNITNDSYRLSHRCEYLTHNTLHVTCGCWSWTPSDPLSISDGVYWGPAEVTAPSNLFICHPNLSQTCSTKQRCRHLVAVVVTVSLELHRNSTRYIICTLSFQFGAKLQYMPLGGDENLCIGRSAMGRYCHKDGWIWQ